MEFYRSGVERWHGFHGYCSQNEESRTKISSAIFAINRAKDCLSKHALRCLYFALVHSHLTYGINVWGNSMKKKKSLCKREPFAQSIKYGIVAILNHCSNPTKY